MAVEQKGDNALLVLQRDMAISPHTILGHDVPSVPSILSGLKEEY